MHNTTHKSIITILFIISCGSSFAQTQTAIYPGEPWPDDKGNHIQAHGGGILKAGKTYYWYGEGRAKDNDTSLRYVSCYSSADLMNWEFRNYVLKTGDPDYMGKRFVLERPKVYYNKKTRKYVMYMHLDSSNYKAARVGIAVCDRPDGDFTFIKSFRPLGFESRDIGQFIDDDGSAYLVFEDRAAKGFHIAKLSDDYMNVEKDICLIKLPLEGGAIVHYDGMYYAIGSALTGWRANPNKYATAETLAGPWSEFADIAPPAVNTYGSQSTLMLKITGTKKTTVVFMGDIWKPLTQWDSRYLWMPLKIGNGKLFLPQPKPWSINIVTGEVIFKL